VRFLIAIFISFTSPNSTENSMLFIERNGENKIIFNTLEECMGHVHYNLPRIYDFAVKSYAPQEIVVEQIGCYAIPAEDEGKRI
jgi:hypothetical protein